MAQGNEKTQVELHFSSETKQDLLELLGSSNIIIVRSIDRAGHRLHLEFGESGGSNIPAGITNNTTVVTGIYSLPDRSNLQVQNGHDRQSNIDVNKPIDQSPWQHKQFISSAKPNNITAVSITSQPLNTSQEITGIPQQQSSSHEESLNVAVSQTSAVSLESKQKSRDATNSMNTTIDTNTDAPKSEQGEVSDRDSAMVGTFSKGRETDEQVEIKDHTVHCVLHFPEMKCNLCETDKECQNKYDQVFASEFKKFLDVSLASPIDKDVPIDGFFEYIEAHLRAKKCPLPCSRLWKYCLDNRLLGNNWLGNKWFDFFQYAPEGLLIYSVQKNRQSLVGTVVDTYFGYTGTEKIASGGFGKVYKFSCQEAVKDEFKRPLITNGDKLFYQVMELDHPNVVGVLEYIAGPVNDNGSKSFLSVMSFKNQQDLHKQFGRELTCVLDYMTKYQNQEKFIFHNYTVLFRHVFKGLQYLQSKGIVHRDIKTSNILVHQTCECESPLQCKCDGRVTYLLGDIDLCTFEKQSADIPYTHSEWKKMAGHDPTGTIGMKPPEAFFRNKQGDHVTTHKSDVWSACVTMMNVLIGTVVNGPAQAQISKFITVTTTESIGSATMSVADSLDLIQSSITMIQPVLDQMKKENSNSEQVDNEMTKLSTNLNQLNKWLRFSKMSLNQSQSFLGGYNEIYEEKDPLAGILTTAYGAQVLHWKCFKKLQHVYGTQLWSVIEPTLDAILAGIKFLPDERDSAKEIVQHLEEIPPVDCSES